MTLVTGTWTLTILIVWSVLAVECFDSPTVGYAPNGQRYVLLTPSQPSLASTPAPILVLPGTAQSWELWEPHLRILGQSQRHVVLCEPLGVGKKVPSIDVTDFSLAGQADAVHNTLQYLEDKKMMESTSKSGYDVVGFSLGGRIGLALACRHRQRIHRLHLTGVALKRSTWGELQIAAWKDLLDHAATNTPKGQEDGTALRPFAWSILLASYAADFLDRNIDQLPLWVDRVCQQHTVAGLQALVHQTHNHQQNGNDEWTVAAMARKLMGLGIHGRLVVGDADQLAPVDQAVKLADLLQWPLPTVLPGASHVPPIETPRTWRQDVKDFLDP